MATEIQINAVVDAIVSAFDGDVAKFEAFLTRAALETELAEIESEIRNLQAASNASADEYSSQMTNLAVERNEKQAEIDALG